MSGIRQGTKLTNQKLCSILIQYLDKRIARPSAKAFIFAYLYVVLPKVINRLSSLIRKKEYMKIAPTMYRIFLSLLHRKKFPMMAAYLVGGINILEPLVYKVLKQYVTKNPVNNLFLSTLISSFISAFVAFPAYQYHILGYGRYYSLDLTLLLVTRAMDTALSSVLGKIVPSAISKYGDALLFIISCSFIMFSWFYKPHALPPPYRKWITSAANMDSELINALKYLREGKVKYGEGGSEKDVLKEYCERYGQDPREGNFIYKQPLDCYTVHAFKTRNCELHALWRFYRGFIFAFKVYGSINTLMLLTSKKNITMKLRLIRAFVSTIRSSCFLGTFIGLYWYAVCLSRKRLFPHLFPSIPKTKWDDTIAPTAGAILCGFSSLIETAQRRKELALFVAPRALGTIVPPEVSEENLKIESFVFSFSLAVLVAYSKSDPKKVRGVFGKGLQHVLNIGYYE